MAIFLVLAVVLGGSAHDGSPYGGVVQLASLPLLFLVAWSWSARLPPSAIILLAAIFLLPLFQLVPLPPAVWTAFPQRDVIAEGYDLAGIQLPHLPISLDPHATWRAIFSLLPPLAMFLATLHLDLRARRALTGLLIALGFVSAVVGMAQIFFGPGDELRLYRTMSNAAAVGFFANRNHFAAFLYGLIPFVSAWIVGLGFDRRPERLLGIAACLLVYAALILALALSLSRTGIVLALVAAVASGLLAANNERRLPKRGVVVIAGITGLSAVLVIQFFFFGLIGRLDTGILTDYRVQMAETSYLAAIAFQPLGSGFGTFVPVYRMFETSEALRPVYANHAHNDWLELWIEGGWLALAIIAGFLVWFGRAAFQAWSAPLQQRKVLDRSLAQAATITITLLLLHSIVDFPLRTTTLTVLLAFCAAMLVPPRESRQEKNTTAERQSRARPIQPFTSVGQR